MCSQTESTLKYRSHPEMAVSITVLLEDVEACMMPQSWHSDLACREGCLSQVDHKGLE
jgi:hypothetical protein